MKLPRFVLFGLVARAPLLVVAACGGSQAEPGSEKEAGAEAGRDVIVGENDATKTPEVGADAGPDSTTNENDGTTGPEVGADAASGSSACATAGGQCVFSDSFCAVPGTAACGPSPVATFCCLHVGGSCGQPAVTTFSAACDGGPPVCQGTPARPELEDTPADAGVVQEYPDASFAAGCTVSYPLCGFDGVYTCTCGEPAGSQGWTCFL